MVPIVWVIRVVRGEPDDIAVGMNAQAQNRAVRVTEVGDNLVGLQNAPII